MQVYLYDNLKHPDPAHCYLCDKILPDPNEWIEFDLIPYCNTCQDVAMDNYT